MVEALTAQARCFINGHLVRGTLEKLANPEEAHRFKDASGTLVDSLLDSLTLLASTCSIDSGFREIVGAIRQGHKEGNVATIRNRAVEAIKFLQNV